MKTNTQWMRGIVAAAVIASGAAAFAAPQGQADPRRQGPGDRRAEGQGHEPGAALRQGPQGPRQGLPPVERLKEIGATEQQIAALKQAAYEQDKEMVTLRANVERAEIELRHLMDAASADKKAVSEAVDTLTAARGAMLKAETLNRLKIRETLGEKLVSQLRQPPPPRQGDDDDRPQPPARPAAGPQGRGGE